jgi:hypothetical protein
MEAQVSSITEYRFNIEAYQPGPQCNYTETFLGGQINFTLLLIEKITVTIIT